MGFMLRGAYNEGFIVSMPGKKAGTAMGEAISAQALTACSLFLNSRIRLAFSIPRTDNCAAAKDSVTF